MGKTVTPGRLISGLSFSRDAKMFATLAVGPPMTVQVWDTRESVARGPPVNPGYWTNRDLTENGATFQS